MGIIMNGYSLDSYENIPTVKCRPMPESPREACGGLTVFRIQWSRADRKAETLPKPEPCTILEPKLTPPAREESAAGYDAADAEAFIRRLGKATDGGRDYAGVVADGESITGAMAFPLLRAWRQAFDNAVLLVRIPSVGCDEIIHALRRENLPFGLLLDASEGLIPLRRQLASQGLQRIWRSSPVYLLAKNAPEAPDKVRQAALGWHVAVAAIPGLRPGQMALRRLTWPVKLSVGGAMPLRFWWDNPGSCPVYGKTQTRLVLRGSSGTETMLPINDGVQSRPLGDSIHNEIIQLPCLEPGVYELACGIFRENGEALELAIKQPCKNGLYSLGTLELDGTPRPELFRIWDDFYPEGYYPTEDPKLPV